MLTSDPEVQQINENFSFKESICDHGTEKNVFNSG